MIEVSSTLTMVYHSLGFRGLPEGVASVAVESVHVNVESGEGDRGLLLGLGLVLRLVQLHFLLLLLSLLLERWISQAIDLICT